MKAPILALLLLSLATAGAQRRYFPGGVGADADSENTVRKNRAQIAAMEAERAAGAARVARVQAQIASALAPFRKWEDGSVGYVGKYIYQREGMLPETPDAAGIRLITIDWQVLDISPAGVRLKVRGDDQDFFVRGLQDQTLYSERTYSATLMVRSTRGRYTYSTVAGGSRTIPEFEFGKPISKDDYTRALAPPPKPQNDLAAVRPATNTPAR
jgi:hypothetical protein